jgi:putative CocE/NonD family hydrolase
VIEKNVPVPMRDGTILRADVYRPDTDAPVPVVVARLPYNRSLPLIPPSAMDPERAVEAGFAFVCQDSRGRYGSEGLFRPFVDEPADGYDTIEWAAAQPWSSGAVGMAGRSYGAGAQWLAAAEQPPHLKALCPVVIGSDFYDGWIYQGGAFQLGFNVFWALLIGDPREAPRAVAHARHLPLTTLPVLRAAGEKTSFYFDWIEHSTNDAFWKARAFNTRYSRVTVPACNVGGWYDVFLGGTLENFARMRREGGTEDARAGQKLIVGPWGHGSTYGPYPDHSYKVFGPDDGLDLMDVQLRFFARHLRGERNGVDDEAPVRLFVMGENRWREESDWPLPGTQYTPWYLRGEGDEAGGRGLSPERPGDEPPDEFVYDPNDPAPTVGGPTSLPALLFGTSSGPLDQKRVEGRPDVLVYTSAPLEAPLAVIGPLRVKLFAATTAVDTDFVAKLTDVSPDGASRILAEGVLRARFREGYEAPRPVEPGTVNEYGIDLVATANVFLPGHRVRLVVTSSSFPRFDRNPNTGGPLGADGPEDLVAARQTIFHDRAHPSHILLPTAGR